MTPVALARFLFEAHPKYRVDNLDPGVCKYREILKETHTLVDSSKGVLSFSTAGRSIEGREIPVVTIGSGPRHILLWSQMHGDESTATLALMDMFRLLSSGGLPGSVVKSILSRASLHVVPMLNPDGAERVMRQTSVGIDMNRDAKALLTPEARFLKKLQSRLKPSFGFNLHDQEISSVGLSNNVAAIALLAPATDESRRTGAVRKRAMRVAALIARVLDPFAGGHISRYDDAFEPRAFGDNMQLWGTSTILVESGHWPNDPAKHFIRRLNFVALLTAAYSIATGGYLRTPIKGYDGLRINGKRAYDVIVRRVSLFRAPRWSASVDIGLTVEAGQNRVRDGWQDTTTLRVKEIGDLRGFGAITIIDGCGIEVSSEELAVDQKLTWVGLRERIGTAHNKKMAKT